VVAVPVRDLTAMSSVVEAETFSIQASDDDLRRLLQASASAFSETHGMLPPVKLSASTSIPRSVGLAGSSALVIAALRALAAWVGHRWDPVELAELALSVERDRLGVAAGLQDRLVQAVGEPVSMRFDPVGFDKLTMSDEMPLFVAWNPHGAEPSDTVHRSLRRRFDAGDPNVHQAMADLAVQAARARRAIEADDRLLLAEAMDRTFDLRTAIVAIDSGQRLLIDLGRAERAAVNSAGSGGSVIGLAGRADD
jgi:glucuronokinase